MMSANGVWRVRLKVNDNTTASGTITCVSIGGLAQDLRCQRNRYSQNEAWLAKVSGDPLTKYLKWTLAQYILRLSGDSSMEYEYTERLRRCRYCNRDMTDSVTPDSYLQNPYCDHCDKERTELVAASMAPTEVVEMDGYLYLSPVLEKAS